MLNSDIIVTAMVYLGFSPIADFFFKIHPFAGQLTHPSFLSQSIFTWNPQRIEKAYEILDLVLFTLKHTMTLFIRCPIDKTEESVSFSAAGEGILGKSTMC